MSNIESVYLIAQPEDNDLVSGRFPPQRVRVEPTDSVNILIRSEDRISGTDYDFDVDLLASSAHIRKLQITKVILPLLPTINANDKSVTVTHDDGDVTFDLIEGYYSVQALANMLQAQFLAAFQSLDVTNSVTVNYDIDRRSINITDDGGENWYIHEECDFNKFGRNVCKFPVLPAGSPTATSVSESTSLGMIYSRFIILASDRLTQDQKSYSIISGRGASNIIAILDIASKYSENQFAVSTSFPGTDFVIDTLEYAPRINILNRNKALKILDFKLIDEFSFDLDTINTPEHPFIYPITIWMQGYL